MAGKALLTLQIDGNAAGAVRAAGTARSALDSVASTAGRMGSALAGAARLTGGALVAVGGFAGAVGIKAAAAAETSEIAFGTMLGGAQQAQDFLGKLSDFAAKTPFDLPGLQKSASSLVSAGIEADKVIPIMTSLGNATSGMGTGAEGVQRATVALQQMNAAGKIGAEDLNQLRDAGVPVFDLLTAATGKTTEQIAEMASKGELGRQELEQLMSALESGKGLEKFNGLMDAQSQSLTGLASTFKDTFSVGMGEAIKPLIPLMKDGLTRATELLGTTVLPKVTAGAAALATQIPVLVSSVSSLYSVLSAGDFTGPIFGLEEDHEYIGYLFDVRDLATGLYSILAQGDFTGLPFGLEEDSAFVDFLFNVRDGAMQLWQAVSTGDTTALAGAFEAFMAVAKPAGPLLVEVGGAIGGLSQTLGELVASALPLAVPLLEGMTGAMTYLSEHTGVLSALIIGLGAAFVLYQAGQIAANLAAALGVPIAATQAAANFSLAAAIRANTAATGTQIVAERTSMITRAQSAAGMVAHGAAMLGARVAMLAGAAATGVATAAQWLFNAALSANPIGIVIVLIAALVAGVILAYNNVGWFRDAVDAAGALAVGAFEAIGVAVGVAIAWLDKTLAPIGGISGAFDILKAAGVLVWDSMSAGISGFVGWLESAVSWVGDLAGKLGNLMAGPIQAVKDIAGGLFGASLPISMGAAGAPAPAMFGAATAGLYGAPEPGMFGATLSATSSAIGSGSLGSTSSTAGNTYVHVEIKADATTDKVELGRAIDEVLRRYRRTTGAVNA